MEFGALRDDKAFLVLNEEVADHIADRMARKFHEIAHKSKGGSGQPSPTTGAPSGANPVTANMYGGKGIIKFNPTSDEIVLGIRPQVTLLTWQSPDGLPHYVTVEVGRIAGGLGGPGVDGGPGAGPATNGVGGGTFPLGKDAAGNLLSYRAYAQVLVGTPGTMQDPFFIDINRGQRFTTLASYVAITANMAAPPFDTVTLATVTGYTSGSMAVYATLGPAVAPTLAPVLFTQYNDETIPGGGQLFPFFGRIIPPRANILLPVQCNAAAITIAVALRDNAGTLISNTPTFGLGSVPTIALPEDAYQLVVVPTLNGTTGLTTFRMIYQLSL